MILEEWRNEELLLQQQCLSCLAGAEGYVRAEEGAHEKERIGKATWPSLHLVLQSHVLLRTPGYHCGSNRGDCRRENHTSGLIIHREIMFSSLPHLPVTDGRK